MDRRHFLQAGGALALEWSSISTALGQTGWTPPYALPASGQVISLSVAGGNTLLDVATAANGWGVFSSYNIAAAIYAGYGFGAFAKDYSAGGAFVIAGCGGHGAGGLYGGFIFDFTTGQWLSKANTNGKVETYTDPDGSLIDWSTGEFIDKTGLTGQLPIPGHGYLWHWCPPKSVSGGTKGYMFKAVVASGSTFGYDGKRTFKFDLDTGLWTYGSDNNMNFDGAYLNPYTDGVGDHDPVTNRFYTTQKAESTGNIRYLEQTATGWTWKKVTCPGVRTPYRMAIFVHGRYLILVYRDKVFQRIDLDNPGAGAVTFTVNNADLLPTVNTMRFHQYPVADGGDGCWYACRGKADRTLITAWVSDGSPTSTKAADQYLVKIDPSTWTVSQVPITAGDASGGITAYWESRYLASPPPGNAFVYVPALRCFAWFPRHDAAVQLIKPPGGSSTGDTQPPTVPANLVVTGTTTATIAWAWNASTDNGGGLVAGYKVALYDSGDVPVGAVVNAGNVLAYTASELSASTTYKLRVSAYDDAAVPNESSPCPAVAGTTATPAGDTQPPTVPANLHVTGTTTASITWAWNASTDNGGGLVAGYKVALYDSSDVPVGAVVNAGNVLTYTASELSASTTYKLRVSAYDDAAVPNESSLCPPVAGTTATPAGDTQPPTVPANLRVTATTTAAITWAWNASTDNGGGSVAGYKVALYDGSGVPIGGAVDVGNVLAYTAGGLSANLTYALRVSAYDNATPANESVLCTAVAGTTSGGADTQPPTVPATLRVRAVSASSITWGWNASTDSGGGSVAGYKAALYDSSNVPIALVDVGNVLTYTATSLTANTAYKLRVSAYDNAIPANESAPCAAVTGTTKKKDPPGRG